MVKHEGSNVGCLYHLPKQHIGKEEETCCDDVQMWKDVDSRQGVRLEIRAAPKLSNARYEKAKRCSRLGGLGFLHDQATETCRKAAGWSQIPMDVVVFPSNTA